MSNVKIKLPDRSMILDAKGKPIVPGAPPTFVNQAMALDGDRTPEDVEYLDMLQRSRVKLDMAKIDSAVTFWKPHYLEYTTDGRHLNGIEAYLLGDPKNNEVPNPIPYIAMCNLMALEGMRRMNEQTPTTCNVHKLPFGSPREKELADFWKKSFAPTKFQSEWAWSGVLSVMIGEPNATHDLIEQPFLQLPQ